MLTWNDGVGTASTVEIIWTLIGLVGLFYSIQSLIEANRDMRVVSAQDDYSKLGPRAAILSGSIERCLERCAVQAGLVLIGVLAMFTPRPVLVQNQTTGAINGSILVGIAILLAFSAVRERGNRHEQELRVERVLMQERRYRLERDLALQRLNVDIAEFDGGTMRLADLPDTPLDASYFHFPEETGHAD